MTGKRQRVLDTGKIPTILVLFAAQKVAEGITVRQIEEVVGQVASHPALYDAVDALVADGFAEVVNEPTQADISAVLRHYAEHGAPPAKHKAVHYRITRSGKVFARMLLMAIHRQSEARRPDAHRKQPTVSVAQEARISAQHATEVMRAVPEGDRAFLMDTYADLRESDSRACVGAV